MSMSEEHSTLLGGAPPRDGWSRRALQVRLLAGELGLPADPAALAACDTRDLLSLAWLLDELLAERGSRRQRRWWRRLAATRLRERSQPSALMRALAFPAEFVRRPRRFCAS